MRLLANLTLAASTLLSSPQATQTIQMQELKEHQTKLEQVEELPKLKFRGKISFEEEFDWEKNPSQLEMLLGIQERLAIEGYQDYAEGPLDETTQEAIELYRELNSLPDRDYVDEALVNHIGMSYKQKLKRTKEAIKAWEYFNINSKGPHVIINIPEFKMRIYNNGELIEEQKVILGKVYGNEENPKKWQTEVQKDRITEAAINPIWNIPLVIQEEMEKPIKQIKGGPKNPLGKVAFKFRVIRYGQILHGTPNPDLFDNNLRAYSHGCIRLENEIQLLRTFQELGLLRCSDEFLEKRLKWKRSQTRIRFKQKIPIDFLYLRAAVVEANGKEYWIYPNDVYRMKSSKVPKTRGRTKRFR